MRLAIALAALLLSGCISEDHSWAGTASLSVVPGDTASHIIEWDDARDGSEGARIVEEALAKAHASRFGSSNRELNESEESAVAQWILAMRTYHGVPASVPVRYMGEFYRVGVDRAGP